MKINKLFEQKKTVFSLEIFPPKKTDGLEKIYNSLNDLTKVNPDFISVTYGAGASEVGNVTCEIAKKIKKMNIEPLAHLTCVNSTKDKVLQVVKDLKANDIENILALRGDINPNISKCTDFKYASDLIKLIKEQGDFNIVGACYPEKHYQNETLEIEIEKLHYKVDAGATHLITQLFFDNKLFYKFIDKARQGGINVPVATGIMPIVATRQIERTVALSGASLPPEFTQMINQYAGDEQGLFEAGIEYATKQIIDLINNGVQGVHIYTMNNPVVSAKIYQNIKNYL